MTTNITSDALKVAKSNPYTGTSQEIANVCISIAKTFNNVSAQEFALYKEKIEISPKIFSKLKVIGQTLLKIDKGTLRDVIQQFPESYSAIHTLCSLELDDLLKAIKNKDITPSMSVREASTFTQQIRFPTSTTPDGEKGKWGYKQQNLFSIVRPENTPMSREVMKNLENDLRKVCLEYGTQLQTSNPSGTTTLRQQEREQRGNFWKRIIYKMCDERWFKINIEAPLRKEFNIKTHEELHDLPLRSWRSITIKSMGSKEDWEDIYGQQYVAKLQMLSEFTEDIGQRYNYRKRLGQLFDERSDLEIWNNLQLKEGGFIK